MMTDENTVRWDLVSQIDEGIRSWSPDELEGERNKFFETILEWLEWWVDGLDTQSVDLETHECDDPRRYLITMEGDRGYVVNIHDPMQGGVGSAESVTGADYSVQYPTGAEEERFLFVQAKRDSYPVKPKQYFAFGGLYMFLPLVEGVSFIFIILFVSLVLLVSFTEHYVPASVRLVPVNSFITRNTLVAFVSFVLFVSRRLPPRACPDLSQGG